MAAIHDECINTARIQDLTEKIKLQGEHIHKIQIDVASLHESASVDREKINQIYSALSEIKMSLSEMTKELKGLQNSPDSFKNSMFLIIIDIMKLAILGGLLYYFVIMK